MTRTFYKLIRFIELNILPYNFSQPNQSCYKYYLLSYQD